MRKFVKQSVGNATRHLRRERKANELQHWSPAAAVSSSAKHIFLKSRGGSQR